MATHGEIVSLIDPDIAAARLNSYNRASRAYMIYITGFILPPIMHLSDEQTSVIFTPRQLENLVTHPLKSEVPDCLHL